MIHVVRKLTQVPYTFVLMNWAALAGLYCFARGHQGFWDASPAAARPNHRMTHA